ncbi:alpha/beta fold hydrolase [Vitiosangium sp. GDMCC 1.1324]|uniref:alpha/beta fold hydrolase n=1 Tax=Vitiosangium sp. (strain GDMCC 1.1324) TaxID=2138576 RepID=UPI00130E97C3|nr:alpha/beta hydrolase [Vitiosangium sp. GDMCC 1.1324]
MVETPSLSVYPPSPAAPSPYAPAVTVLEPSSAPRDPEGGSPFSEPVAFRVHGLEGADGVSLRVYDAGDVYGPPLLFLHGFSQCHLAWQRQFYSALSLGFRLVALDLRGHGHSGKPHGAYDDGRLWAEDLHAVISALELERPLLVAWSYGAMVVADYLRHYGQERVAGVNFVSAMVKGGSEEAFGLLSPELLSLIPGLFTQEDAVSRATLERFVSLLHHQPVTPETRRLVLAYNELVPGHVREAIGSRAADNDDVLRRLSVPVLVSHGMEDRVIRPASGQHIASLLPDAKVSLYPGIGHSPFWEDSRRFNRELAAFAARCW